MHILRSSLCTGLSGLALFLGSGSAGAQSADTGKLKAAIIYNIVRFVEFEPDPGAILSLCVARNGSVARELAALNGRRAGNRTIALKPVDPTDADGCDVVYLGNSIGEIARVRQRGVLVIADGTRVLAAGGTIGVVQTGDQVRFEVNIRAAREDRLAISSKLLRLAARVQQ